jgi:hypothetical protein
VFRRSAKRGITDADAIEDSESKDNNNSVQHSSHDIEGSYNSDSNKETDGDSSNESEDNNNKDSKDDSEDSKDDSVEGSGGSKDSEDDSGEGSVKDIPALPPALQSDPPPALPPAIPPTLPPAIPSVVVVQKKGACCCGCGADASKSNHYCIYTKKRVMVWCYHPDQEIPEGHSSKAWCKGCYNQLEEKQAAKSLTEVLLMEQAEGDKRYEDVQAIKDYILNKCCCGCKKNAYYSEHLCLHSGRKVLATCYHQSTDVDDGIPTAFLCKSCYDKIAPESGTPGRSELRLKAKTAQVQQGERMRKYTQNRSQGTKNGNKIEVGTVVRVKVDKVDRGKLNHKSIPGVIVEIT